MKHSTKKSKAFYFAVKLSAQKMSAFEQGCLLVGSKGRSHLLSSKYCPFIVKERGTHNKHKRKTQFFSCRSRDSRKPMQNICPCKRWQRKTKRKASPHTRKLQAWQQVEKIAREGPILAMGFPYGHGFFQCRRESEECVESWMRLATVWRRGWQNKIGIHSSTKYSSFRLLLVP